jgi:hypothetical protein
LRGDDPEREYHVAGAVGSELLRQFVAGGFTGRTRRPGVVAGPRPHAGYAATDLGALKPARLDSQPQAPAWPRARPDEVCRPSSGRLPE